MSWAIICGVVLFFVGGIIFISSKIPIKKTREQFLQSLEKYLEGKIELMEGTDNSFQVRFSYEGVEFTFEDIEDYSFNGKIFRYFLKTNLDSRFFLTFSEKTNQKKKGGKYLGVNEIDNSSDLEVRIKLPKGLEDYLVHSNDPKRVNFLFEDDKVAHIFKMYKNYDSRKCPFSSLKIVSGVISLEFHTSFSYKPSFYDLNVDLLSIEDYIHHLLPVIRRFKAY